MWEDRRDIRAALKEGLRLIRLHEKGGADGAAGQDAAWFADHAAAFRAALKGTLDYPKRKLRRELPALWAGCTAFAAAEEQVSPEALGRYFAQSGLSYEACRALPAFLSAAASLAAVKGYAPSKTGEGAAARGAKFLVSLAALETERLPALLCEAERLLLRDPAGIYPLMAEETKEQYRAALARLAKETGYTETAAAAGVLAQSEAADDGKNHVGFYLRLEPSSFPAPLFFTLEALAPVPAAIAFALFALSRLPLPLAGAVPTGAGLFLLIWALLFSALRPLWDRLAARLAPPRKLPMLNEDDPDITLPQTLAAVCALLPPANEAAAFCARLKAISGAAEGARTALLLDLPGAGTPALPTDAADLAAVKREIDRLNEKHGGGFLLFVRPRVYAPTEDRYTGYERKRGAIEALVKLIVTGENAFSEIAGDTKNLNKTEYLLALDADTGVPFGTLRRLLCVAAHPLNRPVTENGRVIAGYGCLQPRTAISPAAAGASPFARLFTGSDASVYARRVSERYMDLTGRGLFCGKGLIHVKTYAGTCVDAFPAGRVLSHDMPEGALLGTAYVSNAVLTEGFPARPAAYLRRAHRWVRGDAQNLGFAFGPLKKDAPENTLPALARMQLLDNLRRALEPACCAAGALVSLLLPAPFGGLLFALSLGAAAAPEIAAVLSFLFRALAFPLRRRFFAWDAAALRRLLLAPFLRWGLLPCLAAVQTDALCRGLYRAHISHKKTLEWTPAAQSEAAKDLYWPCTALAPLLFAAALCFGPLPARLLAVFVLSAVPFSLFSGEERPEKKRGLSAAGRETLRIWAGAAWQFFDRYVTADTHFLPPDNVQETPVFRVARRTSPTDIGMYLTGLLAAADLGLLSPADLAKRLDGTLSTLEKLPVYDGLLYNWYDTATLQPLPPAFVSSVDCGNYLVCLTALKAGLSDYLPLAPELGALQTRLETLLQKARLERLYHPGRRLFSVGLQTGTGELIPAYYDTYVSEARLTSFYAVAKRLVPAAHWGAPGRDLRGGGRPAAYSGTAFEYLMPSLFLPTPPHTYAAAATAACVRANERAAKNGRPGWVSESGYYAFDGDLNYQYKAHGLPALALRRDPAAEPVFAPYAAFLALGIDPAGSMRALSRFAALGAYGSCGFYEAVDFSRRALPARFRVIRSFMAHHTGMCLVAAVNALQGDAFVRRFLSDPAMGAAESLLREALPAGAPLHARQKKARPRQPQRERLRRPAPAPDRTLGAFSNGECTLLTDETGKNRFIFAGTQLLNGASYAAGIVTAAETAEAVIPLLGSISHIRSAACCRGETQAEGLKLQSAVALAAGENAIVVPLQIKNCRRTPVSCTLLWYFEPLFGGLFEPPAHPAFRDMHIRAFFDPEHELLLFTHLGEGGKPGFWLGAGFHDGAPLHFAADRETVCGSDPLLPHPFANGAPAFTNDVRFTRPAAAIGLPLRLAPGETAERRLLLAAGTDREAVLHGFARLRRQPLPARRCAKDFFLKETLCRTAGEALLGALFFHRPLAAQSAAAQDNAAPARALWEQGLSGDLPVIRMDADPLPPAAVSAGIRLHALLSAVGIPTDLALLTGSPAAYGEPEIRRLREALGAEGIKTGAGKGCAHILHAPACSPAFLSVLAAAPGVSFPLPQPPEAARQADPLLRENAAVRRSGPLFSDGHGFVPNGFFVGGQTPRPWSHALANAAFGTLVTNASLGFTWALNARLNPITPHADDPVGHMSGERLFLRVNGETYDCVAGAAAFFTDTAVLYGARCGDVQLRVTVETDAVAMKKRVEVRYRAAAGTRLRFYYRIAPLLAERPFLAAYLRFFPAENGVRFENPANTAYPGAALLCCDSPAVCETGNGAALLSAAPEEAEGTLHFTLLFSGSARGLAALRALPFRPQSPARFRSRTGDRALDRFASSLLLHQTYTVRLLSRTGFSQCSGAYGFRDQLQDAANAAPFYPETARTHLLRCAGAQFEAGDALHWFHVIPAPQPHLFGVRTRCADDRLWLPFAAAKYARLTGDETVWDVKIPYLDAPALGDDEPERCGDFHPGKRRDTLYGHCMRAVRLSASLLGARGLPLFGGGDWNDGMDAVGAAGRGESVWLGMFLRRVCLDLKPWTGSKGTAEDLRFLEALAAAMEAAVLAAGWNGRWFRRGFTDAGAPLGDEGNAACEIDLTAQAWATLAKIGTEAQQKTALSSAFALLYESDPPLVRLLAPPFTAQAPRAGYINDYPPGVRENGGQYTHAAVWFLQALTEHGMEAESKRVLTAILPPETEAARAVYKNEPYALSADVGAAPFFPGRGGWSQYTGAAGWLLAFAGEQTKGP